MEREVLEHAAEENGWERSWILCLRGQHYDGIVIKLEGPQEKYTKKSGILVQIQHLPYDRQRPRETLITLGDRRAFRMQTDFQTAVRLSGVRSTGSPVPVWKVM